MMRDVAEQDRSGISGHRTPACSPRHSSPQAHPQRRPDGTAGDGLGPVGDVRAAYLNSFGIGHCPPSRTLAYRVIAPLPGRGAFPACLQSVAVSHCDTPGPDQRPPNQGVPGSPDVAIKADPPDGRGRGCDDRPPVLHRTGTGRHSHSVSRPEISQAPSLPQLTGPDLRDDSGNRTPDLIITKGLTTYGPDQRRHSSGDRHEALRSARPAPGDEHFREPIAHSG